jgi:aminopeptidase N
MAPGPGITRSLAKERSRRLSDLRCAIRFSIPADTDLPVTGNAVLTFQLSDADNPLALDFAPGGAAALHGATLNGTAMDLTVVNGHVVVPADALCLGSNQLEMGFTARSEPLNRREDHLYTIFVPARAHEAFPCFDQPDLRVRWTLALEIPSDWAAVANAALLDRQPLEVDLGPARALLRFAETEPLPTYLFAFAAGRFLEVQGERDGRRYSLYHCSSDAGQVSSNAGDIFDAHAAALRWLEDYTAVQYPFGKFDMVVLPAFQFSGMEHPGAVFYSSATLLVGSSATRQQLLARAHLIAHETAHMWFGDLVTMAWFDDVWMKEVFANFTTAKIVNPQFPDLDHELMFLYAHYPGAYDVDRTAGAHPIRQPLDNLTDAGALYGAIIYLKSPIVMRQLELLIGEPTLRDVLRDYLTCYRFGSASWTDLLRIIGAHTTIDVERWSRDWIEGCGRPVLDVSLTSDSSTSWIVELRTAAALTSADSTWPQHLDVAIGRGSRVDHTRVWLDGRADARERGGNARPDYVLPNGRGLGYGEFRLDPASLAWLTVRLPDIGDPLTRGSAWLTVWDAMLSGSVRPDTLLALALRALPQETSELNLQRILTNIERMFWTFMSPAGRSACATSLETVLRAELDRRPTTSAKAAIFTAFRSIASTDGATRWLHALWSGEARIDRFAIGEEEEIALAAELSVRSNSGREIVGQQLNRTRPGDRRDALTFIAPALSGDPADRHQFMTTLAQAENRRREPWVVQGLRWLHHPLRSEASLPCLWAGLDLVEEVQRTGDIFLPKRWLDAMLGGHQSPDAARTVREFLASRSAYPDSLRAMILASADYLFRASLFV